MLTRISPAFDGGELADDPFGVVWRPDPDPLAGFEAERDQAGGKIVDPPLQFAPAPAQPLMADDERVALGMLLGCAVEIGADSLADQRRLARSVDITWLGHSSASEIRVRARGFFPDGSATIDWA
jgi:hypothetical protein